MGGVTCTSDDFVSLKCSRDTVKIPARLSQRCCLRARCYSRRQRLTRVDLTCRQESAGSEAKNPPLQFPAIKCGLVKTSML